MAASGSNSGGNRGTVQSESAEVAAMPRQFRVHSRWFKCAKSVPSMSSEKQSADNDDMPQWQFWAFQVVLFIVWEAVRAVMCFVLRMLKSKPQSVVQSELSAQGVPDETTQSGTTAQRVPEDIQQSRDSVPFKEIIISVEQGTVWHSSSACTGLKFSKMTKSYKQCKQCTARLGNKTD